MKPERLKRCCIFSRLAGAAISVAALSGSIAYAGTLNYDFSTDPSQGADPIVVGGNNSDYYVASGGNPGGFLAITYPIGSQKTQVVFPDTDPGKVVTAFEFSCDLRVGNPQTARAADGFSISFARDGDPILEDPINSDMFGGNCCAETGTQTGIAVSFDTWSGNTFPSDPKDTTDIEGIIIRVDNVTVKKISLPTRNGLADDPTTLQTGPRDDAYWDVNQGDPKDPASWAGLAWKPFSISLKEDGKLTVKYKGNTLLDNFQTAYFPTAGRLVMAGRTGGANEHTHVDNIKLTTTAASCASVPTVPGNVKVVEAGARRALVSWDASNMAGQTTGIAYEVEVNGKAIPGQILATQYEMTQLAPGGANTFKVRAKNVCAQASDFASLSVTTVAEVDSPGTLLAQVYRFAAADGSAFGGAGQDGIDTVLADANYPNKPDDVYYANGFQFGEPAFGNTFGENHMVRIAGTFVAPKSGSFRFFVRSDDASRLYVKQGTAIPNPSADPIIAQENGCCGGFEEPGAGDNGDGTFPTSEPISLTAGQSYGVLFLVKEGGGGDWGQVGWREEGTKPVYVLAGPVITGGKGDPVGATVNITTPPTGTSVAGYKAASFSVTATTSSPYGKGPYYQWFKNGTPIIGANGPTLDIPVVQPSDNNAKIKVAVSTIGKSVDSPEVTLTVTADVAPAIASVTGSDTFNQATVKFDQPVGTGAATASNYAFDNGLTVSSATVVDQFTVLLNTGTQTSGKAYKLTVNGVQNLGGKAANNATATFTAWDLVAGVVRADQFIGFNGAALSDMDAVIADPKYPNSPDVVRFLSNGMTFGEPNFGDTYGENHMVAMKGILKPTETASYRFFIRSDDSSRLFINTSGAALPDAKTATAIATEAGCCGGFENPGAADNGDGTFPTSEPISLTAGQSYGVLFLVKEGGGGDWGQVAWRKEGDTTPPGSLTPIKSAVYWYGAPPTGGGTTPVVSIASGAGGAATITFTGTLQARDALGTGTWTDVAGATSPYTVPGGTKVRFWRTRN